MIFRKHFAVVLLAILGLLATTMAPAGAIVDVNQGDAFNPIVDAQDIPNWAVRLEFAPGTSCSGSLVDAEFVVTAAHCLAADDGKIELFESDITAYIGRWQVSSGVAKITRHPDWNISKETPSRSDIAVLRLSTPVPNWYNTLQVGGLPNEVNSFSTSVFGYGISEPDDDLLRESRQVATLNHADSRCGDLQLLCMNSSQSARTGICKGDSGGPIVRGDLLIGVMHSVVGLIDDCGSDTSLYTAVYAPTHENWIKRTIANQVCGQVNIDRGSAVRMIGWGETGTQYADVIIGTNSSETLSAGDGHDVVCGRDGLDTIYGGAGDDKIEGGEHSDKIFGGDGVDTIYGGGGLDTIQAGSGNDTIYGGDHNDSILGQGGLDRIYGEGGADTLDGGGSGDTIVGGPDNDEIKGGAGKDYLWGGTGNDLIRGGKDADQIFGQDGLDELYGDTGFDTIDGGNHNDHIFGNAGNDTINAGFGDDIVRGGAGNDFIEGHEGNDTLYGDKGQDSIHGQGGDDDMFGGAGPDRLDGGAGSNTAAGGAGADSCKNTRGTSCKF